MKNLDRMRTCVATGDEAPSRTLIRFVQAPDGAVVADLAGKLPGRGVWTRATREAVSKAAKKGLFARGFKAAARLADGKTPESFADDVEAGLAARVASALGLARRSGAALIGGEAVLKAFSKASGDKAKTAPAIVFIAPETSDRGARPIRTAADAADAYATSSLTEEALSAAVGLYGVKILAVAPPATGLLVDARRLAGFQRNKETDLETGEGTKPGETPIGETQNGAENL